MPAVVSVHIADVGIVRSLRLLTTRTRSLSVDGLRNANLGLAAPLSPSSLPLPKLGRIGLVAFWDDAAAIDAFTQTHPLAEALAGGWQARLEPLRIFGAWPGIDPGLTQSRHTDHEGTTVVITLGRAKALRFPKFLRSSKSASASALKAPGSLWATAIAKPPFVCTVSIWESTKALSTYAYGKKDQGHPEAMNVDRATPFHHESAFVRFRPVLLTGSLAGRNPTPANVRVNGDEPAQ